MSTTKSKPIRTIKDLTPDPRNARKRTERNLAMLGASLKEVGAARSIVIDEGGRILAGNGTVEAAGEAGIKKVMVVEADGKTLIAVRRKGLTADQKKRLSLLDNRTAELAEWDAEVLEELSAAEFPMKDLFTAPELARLLGTAAAALEPGESRYQEQYAVLIVCATEAEQKTVYDKLLGDGYECRVVTT
jgi:ParB-like chromosome segregation protein Spo0J